jgi:coenzyme F420-0:L-glutamate ligase/coenzyme F420-1:gamma-L-glutamate ligase
LGEVRIIPVRGLGDMQPGDDLAALLLAALAQHNQQVQAGDVLVVTQKIVSKAEGRLVDLSTVEPSPFAQTLAEQGRKDAAYYEMVLRESRRIVRMDRGILIAETHHGLICANAGIDESNIGSERVVALLPADPDHSAAQLQHTIMQRTGAQVAVIISDSFGRPWREGQVNVAIGVAGLDPLQDYEGLTDPYGYRLQASVLAVGDELASAAELVMGKTERVPVAIVRGYSYVQASSSASRLLRNPKTDLFR